MALIVYMPRQFLVFLCFKLYSESYVIIYVLNHTQDTEENVVATRTSIPPAFSF